MLRVEIQQLKGKFYRKGDNLNFVITVDDEAEARAEIAGYRKAGLKIQEARLYELDVYRAWVVNGGTAPAPIKKLY